MTEIVPTLMGFQTFVRDYMGINSTVLPDDSPWTELAYDLSVETVNLLLASVSGLIYTQAVYNLAGDILINIAQDEPGAEIVPGSNPPAPYFAWLRNTWNINGFVAGVVQGSDDQGTGQTLTVPKAMENLTFGDLQNLKTPYGRAYLAYAQKYGTLWGLS